MMRSLNNVVRSAFQDAVAAAFPQKEHAPIMATSKFGDFQCNSALALFKTLKSEGTASSPKEVADKISSRLDTKLFSSVQVAPQGFVTVNLSGGWIEEQLQDILKSGKIEVEKPEPLNVLVDFSSPNVAKEMHVGHLRSTIIGDTICRVLEFMGHSVDRVNHVGDWGTQFGMLIEHMKETQAQVEQNGEVGVGDLQAFYRAAKEKFDKDENFKRRAREAVVALQGGDPEALAIWKRVCDVSRDAFQKIYDRLDIRLEEVGESFYNPMLPGVVKELESKNLIRESEGAKCVFTRVSKIPLMAVKSDGGYGYDSTDLAAIRYRLLDRKQQLVVYVTDLGQEEHFLKVFDAAEMAGWYDPKKEKCVHVGFGLVSGEDGKKFKTRSGDVVRLVDLLDEAKDRAEAELIARQERGEGLEDWTDADMKHAAAVIGYGAVKYFDLKQSRTSDYAFSFDRMLDPKGKTVVYLLYNYARICSIFRKANRSSKDISPNIIEGITQDFFTHKLADYMYKVACTFSEFYSANPILDKSGSPEVRDSRLLLCECTRLVLEKSFHLMGIEALERF